MDQASGLKQMMSAMNGQPAADLPSAHQASSLLNTAPDTRRHCRTIAVAGGKGGVGKSTVAVNLGMALSVAGHDVVLLDADMGLANVDVMLGLTPSRHIGHLLDGECTLDELMLPAPRGLRVVPAGSGARRLAQLDNGEHAAIIRAFDELARPPRIPAGGYRRRPLGQRDDVRRRRGRGDRGGVRRTGFADRRLRA